MLNPLFADHPSGDPIQRRWPCLSPKNSFATGGVCINNKLLGAFVHHSFRESKKGRDVPCFGPNVCTLCPRGTRWKGYIPVLMKDRWRIGVLQITENTYYELVERIDMSLMRGWEIQVRRQFGGRRGPVVLEKCSKCLDERVLNALRAPTDIQRWLLRLWDFTLPSIDARIIEGTNPDSAPEDSFDLIPTGEGD